MVNQRSFFGVPRLVPVSFCLLVIGLLSLAGVVTKHASAGGTVVTVNTTANIDDGHCTGAPNTNTAGNCTLHEAIDLVNEGDADIIKFHPPVFSTQSPGVINVCDSLAQGTLPPITRDVVIDSSNTGVIIDGGSSSPNCGTSAAWGIAAIAESNGLDFHLLGGNRNFRVRNVCGEPGVGISVSGLAGDPHSLGSVEIFGVVVQNVCSNAIFIDGVNLTHGSVANSILSSNSDDALAVDIDSCQNQKAATKECPLRDSVLDVSGNRILGGVKYPQLCCAGSGVNIDYSGELSRARSLLVSVNDNEVINGTREGVQIDFLGCGDTSTATVHVDGNGEVNGGLYDAVDVSIAADECAPNHAGVAGDGIAGSSDNFTSVVTVNGNGDLESTGLDGGDYGEGVTINVSICCEDSDSKASVQVNENGRITGEDDGVAVTTFVCCGDDNVSDTSVQDNDEITGEGDDGIDVTSFAGSGPAAGGRGPGAYDADDNECWISITGNDEIDGVGSDDPFGNGVQATCVAGTLGSTGVLNEAVFGVIQVPAQIPDLGEELAGGPVSSGDNNQSHVNVEHNSDIAGDVNGVFTIAASGSLDGEADDNLSTTTVSFNGEIGGDDGNGVDAWVLAGTIVEEGDDNATEITVEGNQEVGGDGGDGLSLNSLSGGITDGSEDNSTKVVVKQNGSLEGANTDGDGIDINTVVCCDPADTNTISIVENKDEITGHDDNGIEIGGFAADGLCCSVNVITIADNEGNIRGGDHDGLNLKVCVDGGAPTACLATSVTALTVTNSSFSDSEEDGIDICCGAFQLASAGIKSAISNNVVEGNGEDGIDIESSSGLNIGPANEVFGNGRSIGDNGIEIEWCAGAAAWFGAGAKVPANRNRITQNSIYDNASLGIDLVGYDPTDGDPNCIVPSVVDDDSIPGCRPFNLTAINPNDCIPFPVLKTEFGNKLVGQACSLCLVEVFWADNTPNNNQNYGEGRDYIVSGQADEDGDFSIELPCGLGAGLLTATSTDKIKNTSEFALNKSTLGTAACPTATPTATRTNTPAPTSTPEPASEAPTEEPATATPTTLAEVAGPKKVCGDANDDGRLTSVDAALVLQFSAGRVRQLANPQSADVNNDGQITSLDASLILQATVAKISAANLRCG